MNRFFEPLSYVGTRIYKTESARIGEARRFYRVCSNLAIGRKGTLVKFARYIRKGLLSVSDAEALLFGRLAVDKLRRYQLAKYWISSGFVPESDFYFSPFQLWYEKVESPGPENIIQFP